MSIEYEIEKVDAEYQSAVDEFHRLKPELKALDQAVQDAERGGRFRDADRLRGEVTALEKRMEKIKDLGYALYEEGDRLRSIRSSQAIGASARGQRAEADRLRQKAYDDAYHEQERQRRAVNDAYRDQAIQQEQFYNNPYR